MCLAVPMRVVEVDGFIARCEAKGIMRDVSLFLMQHEVIAPGDYVLIHVGYAIQKATEEEAQEAWSLFDQILDEEELGSHA